MAQGTHIHGRLKERNLNSKLREPEGFITVIKDSPWLWVEARPVSF
jgi:hypothetical protein